MKFSINSDFEYDKNYFFALNIIQIFSMIAKKVEKY